MKYIPAIVLAAAFAVLVADTVYEGLHRVAESIAPVLDAAPTK